MSDRIQADVAASATIFGIPVITSEYVPKAQHYEADYSRPLIVRLLHGRMIDLREWETDQVFFIGDTVLMDPKRYAVLEGLNP